MQRLQPDDHLIEYAPNLLLLHVLVPFFEVVNFGLQVAPVRELHHYAQCLCAFLKESLFVAYDIRVLNGCEDSHLVQGVLLLFLAELA
jgi:hypothetical protein